MFILSRKKLHTIRRKMNVRCAIVRMFGVMLLGGALYHRHSRSYMEHHDQLSARTKKYVSDEADVEHIVATPGNLSISIDAEDKSATKEIKEIDFGMEDDHEPYLNRWQRRFASSKKRKKKGGYLFFKHIRKAGGTSLRDYFRDVLAYHNVTRNADDWRATKKGRKTTDYQIHYVEHEFQTIDWQCPAVDPRWRESVRIVVLRHPIERHLSEFFFSGKGRWFYPIDKRQLSSNRTYAEELAAFLSEEVPAWMNQTGIEGKFKTAFGRFYTDNFQLRALAGCSSGDCLKGKRVTRAQKKKIRELHPSSYSYLEPVSECTNFFKKDDVPVLLERCAKEQNVKEYCSVGCDGPCFYPSVAWGDVGSGDVTRAVSALKEFDAVLLMEKFGDRDQSDFLSDVLGVPRDANFSLASRSGASNTMVEKEGNRERWRFYRDLLTKLGLKHVKRKLQRENQLEIEFFEQAVKLNTLMIEQWKRENIQPSTDANTRH